MKITAEALADLVFAAKNLSEQLRREPLSTDAGQLAALQVVVAYDNLAIAQEEDDERGR